jgi:hypothetical protein
MSMVRSLVFLRVLESPSLGRGAGVEPLAGGEAPKLPLEMDERGCFLGVVVMALAISISYG